MDIKANRITNCPWCPLRLSSGGRLISVLGILSIAALAMPHTPLGATAQASGQRRSIESGVFTKEQSARGQGIYAASCASCHGASLTGRASAVDDVPPLVGEDFLAGWRGVTVADLFERTQMSMPSGGAAKLTAKQYADVLAYIFSQNGFPSGEAELEGEPRVLKTFDISGGEVAANPVPEPNRSTLEGAFTDAQSRRGEKAYTDTCAVCHAPTLGGGNVVPALAGDDFLDRWNGSTVGDLFDRIRTAMPPDNPGRLSAEQYADIVSYIFKKNKFRAGEKDLGSDVAALRMIRIETSKK